MIMQFLAAMCATWCFAVLYSAPKRQLIYCALTGAIGWIIYLSLRRLGYSIIIYAFVSAFFLTLAARIFAIMNKTPVTVYMVPGIFPIVPGAGIYYTAYYFFLGRMSAFSRYANQTTKSALAISFGIIIAMAIPQSFFRAIFKKKSEIHSKISYGHKRKQNNSLKK